MTWQMEGKVSFQGAHYTIHQPAWLQTGYRNEKTGDRMLKAAAPPEAYSRLGLLWWALPTRYSPDLGIVLPGRKLQIGL